MITHMTTSSEVALSFQFLMASMKSAFSCNSFVIHKAVKSHSIRWTEDIIPMIKMRNAYRILMETSRELAI
jgi:hypothetical protein